MADITLYSRVNNLYYSSEEWSILNPVLQKGEIGFDTTNRNYKVGDGSTNWNNLPFFPLVSQASATTLGGIKVGFPESGKNYPVELNSSGQAFVNVPWTDNNTTYSPGTGISISGTTINHANYGQATTYGQTNNTSASFGGAIRIPYVTTNAQGHVTGGGTRDVTLPAAPTSVSGNAGTATKLQTTRTIALGTGVTGTATSFNGSANITIPVTAVKESYLTWGGKNFNGDYGPIDAAMISELGANRFMFLKAAGITIEYSTNGGSSWTDYGATDAQKVALFSSGQSFVIGKSSSGSNTNANYMLRVTIDTDSAGIYSVLNKFCIYCSTNGSNGSYVTIDAAPYSNQTSFSIYANKVGISGWSGYNIINTSGITTHGNQNWHLKKLRFTFGITGHTETQYTGLSISKIMGFGGVGWTTPSTMAKTGHIYSFDSSQNVTFPAKVTAPSFSGKLSGSSTSIADGGKVTSLLSGSSAPTQGTGLCMKEVYNTTNSPVTYGNILQVSGGGHGELLLEWKGDASAGNVWYRSKRDTASTAWGAWNVLGKAPSVNVGSASTPVYLSNGTLTACSSTIGAATKPVYMSGGTITACSGNVGSASTPIYINNGTFTACSSLSAGVTVSNSTSNIHVLGTTTTGSLSTVNRASGVYISSGTTVNASGGFYVQSARKYKKDIVRTDIDAVRMINDTEVVNFHYKDDENQYPRIGFIADDTDPLLSTPNQDKMDTTNCIGVLLKAIQQLDARLRRLEV